MYSATQAGGRPPTNPVHDARRPRTISELAHVAQAGLQWSARYPLKTWLKGTLTLATRAKEREQQGDLEEAFILTARAATVILEKLPSHPDYIRSLSPSEKANLQHNGQVYLKELSRLKLAVSDRFERWRAAHPGWSLEGEQPGRGSPGPAVGTTLEHGPRDTPPPTNSAIRGRSRRVSDGRRNTVHFEADPSGLGQGHQRSVSGLEDDFGRMGLAPAPAVNMPAYHQSSAAQDAWVPTLHDPYAHHQSAWQTVPTAYAPPGHQPVSYPTVDTERHRYQEYQPQFPFPQPYHHSAGSAIMAPPVPPPPRLPRTGPPAPLADPHAEYYSMPSRPSAPSTSARPASPPAVRHSSSGLRKLTIPTSTLSTFLDLARPNTQRKIETCALLLGTIRERHHRGHQELVVEALLVPKQTGTPDTCQMEEEVLVVEVQMERGLIALGWIHTHPTQSCFMSSMDLHTHVAYQQMLPEAVAIVCAPKGDPSYGIFRLTEPHGLQSILTCKKSQLFHEHPDVKGGIYTDADQGHVHLSNGYPLEVIDLRKR